MPERIIVYWVDEEGFEKLMESKGFKSIYKMTKREINKPHVCFETVRNFLKGHNTTSKTVEKIAAVLGVEPKVIYALRKPISSQESIDTQSDTVDSDKTLQLEKIKEAIYLREEEKKRITQLMDSYLKLIRIHIQLKLDTKYYVERTLKNYGEVEYWSVKKMIEYHHNFVIVGPRSGKTIFMEKLALECGNFYYKNYGIYRRIPLYVTFSNKIQDIEPFSIVQQNIWKQTNCFKDYNDITVNISEKDRQNLHFVFLLDHVEKKHIKIVNQFLANRTLFNADQFIVSFHSNIYDDDLPDFIPVKIEDVDDKTMERVLWSRKIQKLHSNPNIHNTNLKYGQNLYVLNKMIEEAENKSLKGEGLEVTQELVDSWIKYPT